MRPKILLVDDTPANLVALRRLLADSGADLYEATSGNAALALCLEHKFALVLLDVAMPDMDGFEVARLLGEAEAQKDTPIIFVTAAFVDEAHRLEGYRAGAVDYITKPVADAVLKSKVHVFLELDAARTKLERAMAALAERNVELKREIAERKRIEEQVRHQASHDALTGLPNRVLFHERLHRAIQRASRHPAPFALASIDIDGFKAVNDNHGHAAGDALLKAFAARLAAHRRGNDTVARLGGDEFALILEDVESAARAWPLCNALCRILGAPYALEVGGKTVEVTVGASIGVARFESGGEDPEGRLMRAADDAMYAAKHGGKNRCVLAPESG